MFCCHFELRSNTINWLITNTSHLMIHTVKIVQSCLSSVIEAGKGMAGTSRPIQPVKMLELYDMEGCPYCRRVREVMTSLNIDFLVKPCPKAGSLYRNEIAQRLSKPTYPALHDPNTGVYLSESQDIISYLYNNYSNKKIPKSLANLPRVEVQGMLVSAASMLRGIKADPNRDPSKITEPLELYSFEGSPYSRPVRERLCELEISYICHNVAKERWQDAGPAILRLKPKFSFRFSNTFHCSTASSNVLPRFAFTQSMKSLWH